jgi:hypothetical protein
LNDTLKNSIVNIKKPQEVLGEALVNEFEKGEYLSRGNTIAAGYLKGKIIDLLAEVSLYDASFRAYITRGILKILVGTISIPRDSETERYSRQAIKGILLLKENQVSAEEILDEIENLFADYETALEQTYAQFKKEFEIKLDETRKVLEQQLDAKVKFDVDRQSQFRKKWRKMRAELNACYEKLLENYKQSLLSEV